MLVWRTIKLFKETEDVTNRPGQGRPRTPEHQNLLNPSVRNLEETQKDHSEIWLKRLVSTILHKDLNTFPYKHQKKQLLLSSTAEKRLARARILLSRIRDGTLPNIVFSDEKKFNVQQKYKSQNDQFWSKSGDIDTRMITRRQAAASVMVWAAATETERSPLIFWNKGSKLTKKITETIFSSNHYYHEHKNISRLGPLSWGKKNSGVVGNQYSQLHFERMVPFITRSESSGLRYLVNFGE